MKKYPFVLFALALIAVGPLHSESPASSEAAAQKEGIFDLRFPGGSVDDLVDVIAQVTGHRPNLIAAAEVREINLPPFELFSVTRDQMLKAFERVLGALPDKQVRLSREDGFWIIQFSPTPRSPFSSAPQPSSVTRIFHIGPLLFDLRLEDVTTAIETAWEMEGIREGHQLRFHEETKLLFVRGSLLQVSLVERVIAELKPPQLSPEERMMQLGLEEMERMKELRAGMSQRRAQRSAGESANQTGNR